MLASPIPPNMVWMGMRALSVGHTEYRGIFRWQLALQWPELSLQDIVTGIKFMSVTQYVRN
jgi:hypothetical protein